MARRVYLHIGPPKTGTSFLQTAWFQHRDDLASQGVFYPGDQFMDQFRASAVILEKTRVTERYGPRDLGMWDALTARVRDWDGDAILSSEHYAIGSAARARATFDALAGVADEVHVVATLRDLARQIPAAWQQSVKQGSDETFDAYWRSLAADSSRGFWHAQDLPPMLTRWTQGIDPDRVHLVTHTRAGSGPSLLWERMCEVTGVDASILRPVARTNESMGVVHIEMLRRINASLPEDRDRIDMGRMTKSFVTRQILSPVETASGSSGMTLPDDAQAWVVERNAAMVADLRGRGHDVVGDLDDLVPAAEPAPGRTPESVTDEEIAELAPPAFAEFFVHELERRQAEQELRRENRRLRRQLREAQDAGAPDPARSRLRRVAGRVRRAVQPS